MAVVGTDSSGRTLAYRPAGSFQGSGLTALGPGEGVPIEVFGALDTSHRVPKIQLAWQTRRQ